MRSHAVQKDPSMSKVIAFEDFSIVTMAATSLNSPYETNLLFKQ